MNKLKPFFSVVIPLYNKQNYVKKTIQSILTQTFQSFEIVIVNDGSEDDSIRIVETIVDNRIQIFHQKNAGVSAARNKGIEESNSDFIAFLDADDIWLPTFLETIYELIQDFPNAGLYSTAYKMINRNKEYRYINIEDFPNKEYKGVVPNYFKSITKGDNIVCSTATCIPKKIFKENNIYFPVGEKYGEDQYVWARISMRFDVVYDTKVCAIYQLETINNTISGILEETEPHKSILMLRDYRNDIENIEKLKYFDEYIEKHISMFIFYNMKKGDKQHAFKQLFKYNLSIKYKILFLFLFFVPKSIYSFLIKIKHIIN